MSEVQHFCGGGVIGCRCAEYAKLTEQIDGEARKQLEAFWKTQMDLQQTDKKDVWCYEIGSGDVLIRLSSEEEAQMYAVSELNYYIYFYAELS